MSRSRDARDAGGLDLELHPVVGEEDAVGGWELRGAVGEQQPVGARGGVGSERLLRAQVAARLAVGVAVLERRLADQQVGVSGEVRDALARARVARVGERGGAVRHPEAVRLEPVVREPHRQDVEACRRRESRLGVVLPDDERPLEHVGEAEPGAQLLEEGAAAPVDPELRPSVVVPAPVEAAPDPGHEVAPVVEVEMRNSDRVDCGPRLRLAESPEHARPAVEQETAPVALDDVPGVGASRVRPGRGRPDDDEAHVPILTAWSGRFGS